MNWAFGPFQTVNPLVITGEGIKGSAFRCIPVVRLSREQCNQSDGLRRGCEEIVTEDKSTSPDLAYLHGALGRADHRLGVSRGAGSSVAGHRWM